MIAAPLAMLVAIRPLLDRVRAPSAARRRRRLATSCRASSRTRSGWRGSAGRCWRWSSSAAPIYSSFLALRDAPVGPPGHGAELRAFLPIVHGKPVLYAGQDRYAAYELLGADTHVPLVEFPDTRRLPQPGEAVRHRRRLQPDRLRLLLARDARPLPLRDHRPRRLEQPGAAQLQAGRRHPLLRALEADRADARRPPRPARGDRGRARCAGCASPEIRILLANPGRASLFPGAVIGAKAAWDEGSVLGTGEQHLAGAGPAGGRLEPLDPVLLPLRPDPHRARLPASR